MLARTRVFRAASGVVVGIALVACGGGHQVIPAPAPTAPPASTSCAAATSSGASQAAIVRVYQTAWAGPVLFAPNAKSFHIPGHRFCAVEGIWTVPKALPTINCSNSWEQYDGSSIWIAIDGWLGTFKAHYKKHGKWLTYGSSDVLQAGSESDVPCYHGGDVHDYPTHAYFWIEWSGVRNVKVTQHYRNLQLKAGDTIDVRIVADTSGPHAWRRATLTLVDETTGYAIPPRTFDSGCVDCGTPFSRPATLFGNTAEWMVESTFFSSLRKSLSNSLDDFGNVEMTHVYATDDHGITYDMSQTGDATPNIDWMTWNGVPLNENGTLLACAKLTGRAAVTFSRAPYAIATPGQQGKLEPKPQHC